MSTNKSAGADKSAGAGKSAGTGRSAGGQVLQQDRHIGQAGAPTGGGKLTTVGKPTGSGKPTTVGKSTGIVRRQTFNPANTPRTEVAPAVQLQLNSGSQLPNPPISQIAPAVQLQQNSGIQLLNPAVHQLPIGPEPAHLSSNQVTLGNKFSLVAVNQAGAGGVPPPPPGGWHFFIGPPGSGPLGSGPFGGPSGQRGGGGSGQPGGDSGQPGGGLGQPGGDSGQPGGAPERPPTGMPTSQPGNAANTPITEIAPAVQFQQNKRIQGSNQWVDSNYEVFRNYRSEWHDRDWWRSHQSRIVFGVGGWYYWNAGYWYPAWGYDPNAYYAYDGPIYGYNDLPPDQVIADVQEALQQQGYYQGEVDGLLGPPTCAAIADYQRDHGLYITSALDSPTLQSLQ